MMKESGALRKGQSHNTREFFIDSTFNLKCVDRRPLAIGTSAIANI